MMTSEHDNEADFGESGAVRKHGREMKQEKPVRLRIIHETNPEKYFPAVFRLAAEGEIQLAGRYRYSVVKEWFRAWLRDRTSIIARTKNSLHDLRFRLGQFFVRDEVIIMGFAPWDFRLLWYRGLAKRNRVLYHTSWPDWRKDNVPRSAPRLLSGYLQGVWRRFLKHPNVEVISITPEVARSVHQEMDVESTVISHAVPEVFFRAKTSGPSTHSQERSPIGLIYVGEISEKKGIRKVLQITKSVPANQFQFTFVGSGPLVHLFDDQDLPDNVQYLGPIYDRQELAKRMADHDLLILLSQRTTNWEELFGIVLVEAIACGLGVIASNHIGPRTILAQVEEVGLFEESDCTGVKELLLRFAESPKELEALKAEQSTMADPYRLNKVSEAWLAEIRG